MVWPWLNRTVVVPFTLFSAGAAAWILRSEWVGRPIELTLGRHPDLTLAAARKLAAEKGVEIQQGKSCCRKVQGEVTQGLACAAMLSDCQIQYLV
ncbi:MAG: Arm DNA-binding domain-containing protein [Comamonas sp.]